MSPRLRRFIGIAVAVLVILWGLVWLQQLAARKTVTLDPAAGVTITFGTPTPDTPSFTKVLIKTTVRSKVKVEKGFYLARFTQAGRVTQYTYMHINTDRNVSTPQMPYTSTRLADLLKSEALIVNSQLASNPATAVFTPGYEQIYGTGDWFAAVLVPSSGNAVKQRVILHKKDGQWEIAAGPAATTLFIGNYPWIPSGVIRDINYH